MIAASLQEKAIAIETALTYFLYGLGYVAVHFAAYTLFFRKQGYLRSEKRIFLFHFISTCLVAGAITVSVLALDVPEPLSVIVGVVAMHGIYSLSFLEMWSLSQGSYSFSILAMVRSGGVMRPAIAIEQLGKVGDTKKSGRLGSLSALGLVCRNGDALGLTPRGRSVAMVLRALQWLTNLKDTG